MNRPQELSATSLTASTSQFAYQQTATEMQSLVARLLATLRSWQFHDRSRRDLLAMDDHLLRDIGLTRAQVESESRKAFWQP